MTGKTILIAAVACVGVVGAIQGFFSIGCTTDGSGGSGSAPDGEGDGGNTTTQEEPPLSLQERLARCEETKPNACPGGNDDALKRHEGLVAGAICQFQLIDQNFWDDESATIDALGKHVELVDVATLLGDLDHKGVKMEDSHKELDRLELMYQAFGWDSHDHGDSSWMPQGVSGSADANDDETIGGRKVVAIAWYHKPENSDRPGVDKGSRISFVDVTELPAGKVPYTHALFVDPFMDNGVPNFRPVRIHVGGIAWIGRYVYAADTMNGLRVFDTQRILKITDTTDEAGRDPGTGNYRAYGHRYAIPQVGAYFQPDSACWHRFSFVAADKTTTPPSLVTGEFHDGDIAGKVIRWDLDGDRLAFTNAAAKVTQPSEVYLAQESDMQGAVSFNGHWYLSSSGQDGAWGLLYRTAPGEKSQSYGWVIGPEDLMFSRKDKVLWSASEFAGRRYVFSVDVDKY